MKTENTMEGKTYKLKDTDTTIKIIRDDTVRKTVIGQYSNGKSTVLSYSTLRNNWEEI